MKLNILKFALAGGIYFAVMVAISTIAALMNIPGLLEFSNFLTMFYGFYGYSISWTGVVVGAFWGFVEGFFHLAIFAWLYNKLLRN